jgi:hypothetical protein
MLRPWLRHGGGRFAVRTVGIIALTIGLLTGASVGAVAQEPSAPVSEESTVRSAQERPVRVIELEAPNTILLPELSPFPIFSFTQDGARVDDIPVTPGETILFRIDNTTPDGHTHNFYIGTDEELLQPRATTETGIADWAQGVQELEWTVPDDITGLKFGCTFPSHYAWMQGTFSISP